MEPFTLTNGPYTLLGGPSNNTGGVSFVVQYGPTRVAGQKNGAYGISFSAMPGKKNVVVDYFQIRPAVRYQGHGSSIMAFLASWYKEGGTEKLTVTNETPEGRIFYPKCGFEDVCGLGFTLDLSKAYASGKRSRQEGKGRMAKKRRS